MKLSRIALAVALTPACVLAEQPLSREQALQLSDTLITASRSVEQRSASSAASTVFTRADIERLRPVSVPHLLAQVAGVQIANYGARGAACWLDVGAASPAQILVLFDGVPGALASGTGAVLQFLNVGQIERIEVLRRSRPDIHGADATGGVTRTFTRRGYVQGVEPRPRL